MKKILSLAVMLVLCLSLLSPASALQVVGTRLTDDEGNPVQLRGISTHGLAWFPQYVTAQTFASLKEDFGCNAVRLAMYVWENGGYCNGGDQNRLKNLIRSGVQYAREAGMYAIVDWHVLNEHDPNLHTEEAIAFFAEMSAELGDEVIYEICNEPNGDVSWADIRRYAEQVIPAIRANAPGAVILVGTPNWSQFLMEAAADPLPYENIMYTLHFYAATHGQYLRDELENALAAGLPVFVSEYGVCSADGNGSYDFEQADLWADLLDEHQISYMMWSLSNKAELASVLKPSCAKLSGFTLDDLTEGGRWLVQRLGGGME